MLVMPVKRSIVLSALFPKLTATPSLAAALENTSAFVSGVFRQVPRKALNLD
jgi:hypothetical protein